MQTAKTGDFQPFDASKWRMGIVVAQFNQDITTKLLASAKARAQEYRLSANHIKTFEVAGAVEIPLALQQLALTKQYDVLLALGCVIQGDTPHFDYVCKFVTDGILRVQLDNNTPVGFGILTCRNHEQAEVRANLGNQFVDAVMQQAQVIRQLRQEQ